MSETDELKTNPTVEQVSEFIVGEIEKNTTAMLYSIKQYDTCMADGAVENCVSWARDAMSAQAVRETLIALWEYMTGKQYEDALTELMEPAG